MNPEAISAFTGGAGLAAAIIHAGAMIMYVK
jgi:hypothetical protein